jgi:hypothetical protein
VDKLFLFDVAEGQVLRGAGDPVVAVVPGVLIIGFDSRISHDRFSRGIGPDIPKETGGG